MVDFVGLHGREIEEQYNEASVFELGRSVCRGSYRSLLRGRRLRQRLCLGHIQRWDGIDVLHVEGKNLLLLVVFEDREILRLHPSTNFPFLSLTVTFTR